MKFPEVISYMEIRIACYVYFQGKNLIERLHVTAAVQNMQRFDGDQPCHTSGRCLDCRSKSRGCNALLVLWGQMMDMAKVEVVLIDEPLGL